MPPLLDWRIVCVGGQGAGRSPQSMQSVYRGQALKLDPGPPSSQYTSSALSQTFEHVDTVGDAVEAAVVSSVGAAVVSSVGAAVGAAVVSSVCMASPIRLDRRESPR